ISMENSVLRLPDKKLPLFYVRSMAHVPSQELGRDSPKPQVCAHRVSGSWSALPYQTSGPGFTSHNASGAGIVSYFPLPSRARPGMAHLECSMHLLLSLLSKSQSFICEAVLYRRTEELSGNVDDAIFNLLGSVQVSFSALCRCWQKTDS
ncbi:RIKEN cDNA 9230106D20, partial [Mus musculus]